MIRVSTRLSRMGMRLIDERLYDRQLDTKLAHGNLRASIRFEDVTKSGSKDITFRSYIHADRLAFEMRAYLSTQGVLDTDVQKMIDAALDKIDRMSRPVHAIKDDSQADLERVITDTLNKYSDSLRLVVESLDNSLQAYKSTYDVMTSSSINDDYTVKASFVVKPKAFLSEYEGHSYVQRGHNGYTIPIKKASYFKHQIDFSPLIQATGNLSRTMSIRNKIGNKIVKLELSLMIEEGSTENLSLHCTVVVKSPVDLSDHLSVVTTMVRDVLADISWVYCESDRIDARYDDFGMLRQSSSAFSIELMYFHQGWAETIRLNFK